MNCQPVQRILGLIEIASLSAGWSGIWHKYIEYSYVYKSRYDKVILSYIVGDDNPLVVVDELLVVGGGVVPTLGGAVLTGEGDGVAGPGVDVSFYPGHHRVIRACEYPFKSSDRASYK